MLEKVMDASPINPAHIKHWTVEDSTLTKVQEVLVTGSQDELAVNPYQHCWSELSVEQVVFCVDPELFLQNDAGQ